MSSYTQLYHIFANLDIKKITNYKFTTNIQIRYKFYINISNNNLFVYLPAGRQVRKKFVISRCHILDAMLYMGKIIAATIMPTATPITSIISGSIRVIRLFVIFVISRP
jgi:hypothetical protein